MAIAMRIFLFLLVINACALATSREDRQHRQQRQQRQRGEKMFSDLNPQDARVELETDGGKLEVWGGRDSGVFEDANVAACRMTLKHRGLRLPAYIDSPALHMVTRGCGRVGVIGSFGDRHSHETTFKVEKGDVVATPEGMVLWWYNDQNEDMEIVGMADVTETPGPSALRAFHLAGGMEGEQQRSREEQRRRRGESEREDQPRSEEYQRKEHHHRRQSRGESTQVGYGAVLHGFSSEVLSRAWDMDKSTLKEMLQRQEEIGIVRLDEDIRFPDQTEERENVFFHNFVYRYSRANPDIRVKKGGELRELNSFKLPILKRMGLGMECVKLQKDAMVAPNWFRNAHQVLYVMSGRGRIEAVRNNGETALQTDLEQGSLVVIPAFFPSTKIAGDEEFHYISFLTTDKPMISYMAGRNSVYQGIPARVLSRMFNIDEKQARQIHRAHQSQSVILPSETSSYRRESDEDEERRRRRQYEEEEESRRHGRRQEEEERRRQKEREEESRRALSL